MYCKYFLVYDAQFLLVQKYWYIVSVIVVMFLLLFLKFKKEGNLTQCFP
jgi:hypothetical protein